MKTIYDSVQRVSIIWLSCILIMIVVSAQQSFGQLDPMGAVYYQNQYLANPAMSALDNGLKLNLGLRQQQSSVSGAPLTQYFSGEYRFADKAGAGLMVFHDKAGLLSEFKFMGTFSYHLPLTEERQLHFGISAGAAMKKLDMDDLSGDFDDPVVSRFNDRGLLFDGDFGVAYSDSKFTVQATFPNMRTVFDKEEQDMVDRPLFFVAASYTLTLNEVTGIALEPKVAVRGIKGHDSIIDAGANLSLMDKKFNAFALYHSSKNYTLGLGARVKEKFTITVIYTSQPTISRSYGNGNLEVGLAASLWNNK
jgi:type IX secretion system PorP/SprF family membrane protein